jgi:hypothetical protein
MAPNLSPNVVLAIAGVFLAVACSIAVAIFFLGRFAGRVFPPARHVAPLALAALAWWLLPVRDSRLTALWILAGIVGAIDALLQDADRRFTPAPSGQPPEASTGADPK